MSPPNRSSAWWGELTILRVVAILQLISVNATFSCTEPQQVVHPNSRHHQIHAKFTQYNSEAPAPRGLSPQPSISSGSDHSRSHMAPSWGTSCLRSMLRICGAEQTADNITSGNIQIVECTHSCLPSDGADLWRKTQQQSAPLALQCT